MKAEPVYQIHFKIKREEHRKRLISQILTIWGKARGLTHEQLDKLTIQELRKILRG
jgi:hypothetical protein